MDAAIEKLKGILKESETKQKILDCLLRSSQANLSVKETMDKMCIEESPIGRLALRVEALKGLIAIITIDEEIAALINEL